MKKVMKNPRTRDISQYVDVDLQINELNEKGEVEEYGEWMPHTILADDDRFEEIANGSLGEVKYLPDIRDVSKKFREVMAKGVQWTDAKGQNFHLSVNQSDERDRILSAALRLSINNTLPKNKSEFNYPDIHGETVMIPKGEVQDVSMLIQDYVEDCHDNYQRLVKDESLDIDSGWPE